VEPDGVVLRGAVAGDLARLRALASSEAAEPWLGVGAADQLAGAMEAGEMRVVEHPPGAAVGAARLVVVNRRSRIGEVKALMLEPGARGRGLAVAALHALAAEAFGRLELHRLQAEVYAFNEASLRVFDRAGFTREGVRRAAYDRHGAWQSSVLFGLLAEDAGR
jgi:RimJ/RimL family protein N-acetyltransferase